jgi:hypothetical protein
MLRLGFTTGIVLILFSTCVFAQEAARTVQYHSEDIIPVRAKVRYTTLIELPATEKIMEAATGDKDFWIVDVVGNFCFVHPAKAGISSNLNLITDKGNIYSFTLQDVSISSGEPDLKVIVQPADRSAMPYVLYEGTILDTVLMNRLDGDAAGPVKVLVSNPAYSHDHQHIIVPDGTVVLGEARKIGAAGFGQQRRMAVVFHRMIMPDGYSVDLDQFHGLDQIGEEGLKDKINNHYLQIFGTSIALGVIAGAAQIEQGGGTLTGSGSQLFTNGASASVSESATTILNRFMQIPPTITIREGHRVKVYFTQDMLLPAYSNHDIPQTF